MTRIGTVVWADVQYLKLAARVVVVPGFYDYYVHGVDSLGELIAGLGSIAVYHNLDVLRFSRDVVKSLERLAKDPKWNRDLVNPHPLPPLPQEGEEDRRQQ